MTIVNNHVLDPNHFSFSWALRQSSSCWKGPSPLLGTWPPVVSHQSHARTQSAVENAWKIVSLPCKTCSSHVVSAPQRLTNWVPRATNTSSKPPSCEAPWIHPRMPRSCQLHLAFGHVTSKAPTSRKCRNVYWKIYEDKGKNQHVPLPDCQIVKETSTIPIMADPPTLFLWMPVRKSGTSFRGANSWFRSPAANSRRWAGWCGFPIPADAFAQGPNPNLFDNGKTRLKKTVSDSISIGGITEIIHEYVCWTLSTLLSIRLFSNRRQIALQRSTSMREVASKMAFGTHNTNKRAKNGSMEKNTNQHWRHQAFSFASPFSWTKSCHTKKSRCKS